ncbi:MAG: hypothetical protein ACK5CK_13560, partial [Burkholderiaceae bacterium]
QWLRSKSRCANEKGTQRALFSFEVSDDALRERHWQDAMSRISFDPAEATIDAIGNEPALPEVRLVPDWLRQRRLGDELRRPGCRLCETLTQPVRHQTHVSERWLVADGIYRCFCRVK